MKNLKFIFMLAKNPGLLRIAKKAVYSCINKK